MWEIDKGDSIEGCQFAAGMTQSPRIQGGNSVGAFSLNHRKLHLNQKVSFVTSICGE